MDKLEVSTENKADVNQNGVHSKQEFGAMMRALREPTGISQEQLAHTTRISLDFITALEDGRVEDLPGLVFGRGFIRCICKLFGADVDIHIQAFDRACAAEGLEGTKLRMPEQDAIAEYGPSDSSRSAASHLKGWFSSLNQSGWHQRLPLPGGAILAGLGLMIVVPVAISLLGEERVHTVKSAQAQSEELSRASEEDPRALAARESVLLRDAEDSVIIEESEDLTRSPLGEAARGADAVEAEVNVEAVVASESTNNKQTVANNQAGAAQQSDQGLQRLSMKVVTPVKIRIKQDRLSWTTKNLDPGEYRYDFEDQAQLLIFDASAVNIEFNGKSLGSLGGKGRIRRLSFAAKADDVVKKNL